MAVAVVLVVANGWRGHEIRNRDLSLPKIAEHRFGKKQKNREGGRKKTKLVPWWTPASQSAMDCGSAHMANEPGAPISAQHTVTAQAQPPPISTVTATTDQHKPQFWHSTVRAQSQSQSQSQSQHSHSHSTVTAQSQHKPQFWHSTAGSAPINTNPKK